MSRPFAWGQRQRDSRRVYSQGSCEAGRLTQLGKRPHYGPSPSPWSFLTGKENNRGATAVGWEERE